MEIYYRDEETRIYQKPNRHDVIAIRLRADWTTYLHQIRKRGYQKLFQNCPKKLFDWGLELGAGDGCQSSYLAKHAKRLICSEYNADRLMRRKAEGVYNLICDAEQSDQLFHDQSFDLIYSSNMLEHVPHPQKVLNACASILKDDGVCIHIVPSVFWKFCHIFLYMPVWAVAHLETLSRPGGYKGLIWELKRFVKACIRPIPNKNANGRENNNPKTQTKPRPHIFNFFIPQPHGVSTTNTKELFDFRVSRWKKMFESSGLELVKIQKGPVASGYGFGFNRLRAFLEKCGLASEIVYIAKRKNGTIDSWP